jgi:hypothetical protein
METTDKLWSKLNTKYGRTNYRSSLLPEKETIVKVVGLIALLLCAKALYEKYNAFEESGEDLSSVFGDTSVESIIKSSLFGFTFVVVLRVLSDKVVDFSEDIKQKFESATPISNLPIPTGTMPIIVALLVGEAADLLATPYFSSDAGTFELGHITGILSGVAITHFLGV